MINLRKQRQKFNRNSLLITGSSQNALIQIVLNAGCFENKDLGTLNSKDSLSVYNFLCSLFAFSLKVFNENDSSKLANIVVLIDATKVPVKALRLILKSCQNALAYKIKQAIIIEPDRFFNQQRISLDILLESYDFKTLLSPKTKLWKYVNVVDLAECFTGINTMEWTDIKKKFDEHFSANPFYVPKSSPHINSTKVFKFLQKDQSIFIELSSKDPMFDCIKMSQPTTEWHASADTRNSVIHSNESSAEIPSSIDHLVDVPSNHQIQEPESSPETVLRLLDDQKSAIDELLNWIRIPAEKWLASLDDIGESVDEARQLEKEHRQLSTKMEEIVDQSTELQEVAEYLLKSEHSHHYEPLKELIDEMITAVHTFRSRVNKQSLLRANSIRLFEIVSEFNKESDTLLKSLCSDVKNVDESSFQMEIDEFDKKLRDVEEKFEMTVEICSAFCNLLQDDENSTEKKLTDIRFVKEQLTSATDRRKRCHELVDLHKLKLQQTIQLMTCERDEEQAIKWLEEILNSLCNDGHARFSDKNSNSLAKINRCEETGKSIHEYGKQLCQVALLLRRSLRLEILPQIQISDRLEKVWKELRQLIEHKKKIYG